MNEEKKAAPSAGTDGAGSDGAIYRGVITVTRIGKDGRTEIITLGPSFKLTQGQVQGTEDLFIGRLHSVQITGEALDDLNVIRELAKVAP